MSAVFNIQGIEVVEVRDGDGGIGDIMRPRIVLPLLGFFMECQYGVLAKGVHV